MRSISDSDNRNGDDAYFAGRCRIFQTNVQGRFKQSLPVSDVLTGHVFIKPLEICRIPGYLESCNQFDWQACTRCQYSGDGGFLRLAGFFGGYTTSQAVRGDEPGNEPDIASTSEDDIQEDCSLAESLIVARLMLRVASFTWPTPNELQCISLTPKQRTLLNVATYCIRWILGVASINITPILNGQPIQCLCKTADGRYLWTFQIWHESILPPPTTVDLLPSKKRKTS